jgi:hypothetical protein
MRARLLVIAMFVSASAVPGLIAYSTGVLPSSGHDSGDDPMSASPEFRVTSLGWPDKALGLASTAQRVVWEQRTGDRTSSGLWAYDVKAQLPFRLLGPHDVGQSSGFPSTDGATVAWAARPPGTDDGPLQIRAFDTDTRRRFTVSAHGADPQGAGNTIVWIDTGGGGRAPRTTVLGRNTVTDERFFVTADGVVREVAAWGPLVAWTTGQRGAAHVWATDRRRQARYQLSMAGTGVAVDRRRVVWAAPADEDRSAIVVWNQRTRRSKELCRVSAHARSLDIEGDLVVWAQDTGGGDIWAYDFNRRRAFAVCGENGEQALPVLVGRTVFWADKRSGQWELYGRALQP